MLCWESPVGEVADTNIESAGCEALWAHIKANDLQREGDKRTIDCDDTLKALLGQDEVTMFSMNKYIGQHFIKE